jgi:hypothetical protein
MRQELCPTMTAAYAAWRDGDAGGAIGDAARIGRAHWQRVCEDVLALWVDRGVEAQPAIAALSASAATRL